MILSKKDWLYIRDGLKKIPLTHNVDFLWIKIFEHVKKCEQFNGYIIRSNIDKSEFNSNLNSYSTKRYLVCSCGNIIGEILMEDYNHITKLLNANFTFPELIEQFNYAFKNERMHNKVAKELRDYKPIIQKKYISNAILELDFL